MTTFNLFGAAYKGMHMEWVTTCDLQRCAIIHGKLVEVVKQIGFDRRFS